jgi:hypothetical protein
MHRCLAALASLAVVTIMGASVHAQQVVPIQEKQVVPVPPPGAKPSTTSEPAAVRIDIVLSRTSGNKTLSSLPYSLHAAEGKVTHLRLGSNVPVPMSVVGGGGATSVNYQNVGSSIDCDVRLQADGRYRLSLVMDDSSLADQPANVATGGVTTTSFPIIRSYRIDTLLVLRNGEATTFNVATDKVSGDTIRAQVTVTALK